MERYERYDFDALADLYSGPDALMLTDELTKEMRLTPEMKVLDLGCGNALSSLFLVKEYGCRVYAVDPKSSSANNYEMAKKQGVEDRLIPLSSKTTPRSASWSRPPQKPTPRRPGWTSGTCSPPSGR